VTPSSGRKASFNIAVQRDREGTKGSKRRCKQRPQGATTMVDGDNEEAGGFGVAHVTTIVGRSKRQARLPIDHFERLIKEAYPNHAYPAKHKLRDCGMMKNFIGLGSLTRGIGLDEVPGESDAMPFPGEDAIMTIYDGRPTPCV
jgi:hypothetical protein